MRTFTLAFFYILLLLSTGSGYENPEPLTAFDIIIRRGTLYDGTGAAPFVADVAIQRDTIAAIGDLQHAVGKKEIYAHGLAVAPGFINMLSWAETGLARDGLCESDIRQGVTLEVLGEGWSPGPVRRSKARKSDAPWNTLGEYFDYIAQKGITPNVASFVGGTTVRIYVMDHEDRPPRLAEMQRMKRLVAEAMEDGALGLGTSLIYPPASYASTEELIALSRVVSGYGGMYITHMRNEGDFILDALDETITIASRARIPAEIYHLKINIARNWNKIDTVLKKIDSARHAGLRLTANMYPYIASGTGLVSRLPNWVQEGGSKEMRKRLKKPEIRNRVLYEMRMGIPYKNSDPENVVLMHFRLDSLNDLYRGKTLSEVARIHGKDPDETVIDLITKDKSRIESLYYLQSEENVKKIIRLPYVSFGSDAGAFSLVNDQQVTDHPRAFGTFSRVLGKYVRDEKLMPLQEAIRKLTGLPAANLSLKKRGLLHPGYFADITIFDPEKIKDLATFEDPQLYAAGTIHVLVNGIPVLENGALTYAKPGRIIRGPGYKKVFTLTRN